MKIVGPTHGSTATSGAIEAGSKGLDNYGGQTVGAQTNTLFDWVRPGCTTKLYVDLSGIPTWMMVHMSTRQMPVRDAEYIREAYSQVFRNGGENVWLMPREFFEREIEDARDDSTRHGVVGGGAGHCRRLFSPGRNPCGESFDRGIRGS